MRLLCNKCGRKAIPPQRLRGQGELMCRRHLFICVLTGVNKLLVVAAALVAGLLIWRGEIPDDMS